MIFSRVQRVFIGVTLVLVFLSMVRMLMHHENVMRSEHNQYDHPMLRMPRNVCFERAVRQSGKYWIIYNFLGAQVCYQHNESITLTTHGEFQHLELLPALVDRWRGPVSIVLYVTGTDFKGTLNMLRYLYDCHYAKNIVRRLVTFHLCLHSDYLPTYIPKTENEILDDTLMDCRRDFYEWHDQKLSFRQENRLRYPINLLRNIARTAARTYFVFPLDFHILPTPNFIERFLRFVEQPLRISHNTRKSIYCLPIFELTNRTHAAPTNKLELAVMMSKGLVRQQNVSAEMPDNNMPFLAGWMQTRKSDLRGDINLLGKIGGLRNNWAPYYVTVNEFEPLYDVRFSASDLYDIVSQSDLLQLLNYDFLLLNSAFLVQMQGIRSYDSLSSDATPYIKRAAGLRKSSITERNILFVHSSPPESVKT